MKKIAIMSCIISIFTGFIIMCNFTIAARGVEKIRATGLIITELSDDYYAVPTGYNYRFKVWGNACIIQELYKLDLWAFNCSNSKENNLDYNEIGNTGNIYILANGNSKQLDLPTNLYDYTLNVSDDHTTDTTSYGYLSVLNFKPQIPGYGLNEWEPVFLWQ